MHCYVFFFFFFFSSRRRHTRFDCDWSSDVCSSDLCGEPRRQTRCRRSRPSHRPCRDSRTPASSRRSRDRKSTRLNSSHSQISYAVFCLKKKKHTTSNVPPHQCVMVAEYTSSTTPLY